MVVNMLVLHKCPLLWYSKSIVQLLCFCLNQSQIGLKSQWTLLINFLLLFFYLVTFAQMAHRLLVRRIWSLSAKEIRCLPASTATTTASSSYSTSLQSATTRVSFLSPSRTLPRSLPHTSRREVSFNVQDHEDFTERVINSQLPVLIDFHAQWVPQGGMAKSY